MKLSTKGLHNLASNPLSVFFGTIASVLSFCWLVYEKVIIQAPGILSILIFLLCIVFFISIGAYSGVVRRREIAFHGIMKRIHKINHDYRDILRAAFGGEKTITERHKLVEVEERILRSVCQQIREIYELLINRPCMVTIKLITKEPNGSKYCSIYVRSEDNCKRDREGPSEFELGKWKNTSYDKALLPAEPGGVSHFYSGDLLKEENYNSQRQHWERYYKSMIVIPIRSVISGKGKNTDEIDDVGFLSLDTLSRNRLNKSYHVELVAAFADEIYNFISLMRGRYIVTVK